MDQPEHRLSHYVNTLLERIVMEPCWFSAVETGTVMIKRTPQARMNAENNRRTRGIKPHALDWMLYQYPKFGCFELKIKSIVSSGQEQTMAALSRQKIPSGVCRSVLDVYRFLVDTDFALHANAVNIAREVEARWRAAQDAADMKKGAPAKPSRKRAFAPKPTAAQVRRGHAWTAVRP